MNDLLSVGASGVLAYRSALSVVGDNVANAQTEGYSRRTLALKTTKDGVETGAITRAYDMFKSDEARISSGDAGRADARARWLATAEIAIGSGESGAGAQLSAFFSTAQKLAADPGSDSTRRAMLTTLDDAAGVMRKSADSLAGTAAGIAREAQISIDGVNGDLSALAAVNLAIKHAGAGTSGEAGLADERDRLLDSLASKIGIKATIGANGAATVELPGSNGVTLINEGDHSQLSVREATDGRLATLVTSSSGETRAASVTGGSIAGLVEVANTIAGRRQELDDIAADFASALNGWQAEGKKQNGEAGPPLLAIAVGAATLRIATDDPNAIAAASDSSANGNLTTLEAMRDGGAETRLAALVAGHAQAVASAKAQSSAAATRRDGTFAARDETTGVDLDSEAADLIRFQQAYEGSAKLLQVARETLQSIFDLF